MMRCAKLWLALLPLPTAWAEAFVQFKHCSAGADNTQAPDQDKGLFGFNIESLRASLQPLDSGKSRIQLAISGRRQGASTCHDLSEHDEATTTLRLETLGSSETYTGYLQNTTCVQHVEDAPPLTKRTFSYDVHRPHLLDNFFMTIETDSPHDTGIACLNAPLTPAVDNTIIGIATWAPACILILVIVAALWRETVSTSSEDSDDPDELGPLRREPRRTHVTRVADYVSYLQFIFFASALSLRYPGFLQPVTSRFSWSTLMLRAGVVVRDPWYDGVRDGIYEINGTFGGTPGLELMTQSMGGTVTTDTWLNTAALAAMVFMVLTGVVILGQRLTWTRDWFQATHSLVFRSGQSNARAVLWTTFRLFCSYLLMPLVAWSAYLVGGAKFNPIYYTIAATAVICVLIFIIWWTMIQGKPRTMGYLLIDSDEENRDLTTLSRTQDLYSAGVFAIIFLRGAAVGALQAVGNAQLSIMVATEIIQIALHVVIYRATPYSSRAGCMPLIRLVVLVLQFAFLPDAAGHGPKMVLGYVILIVHTGVLLMLFLLPTLWDLVALAKDAVVGLRTPVRGQEEGIPQIFGLRQLMRRPTNPANPVLTASTSPSWDHGPSHLSVPPLRSSPALPPRASTASPIDGSYYFRPPRLSSAELISRSSMSTLPVPESPTSSTPKASGSDRTSHDNSRSSSSPGAKSSESHPRREGGLKVEDEDIIPSPLDPSVDYSVREADKYYVRPRKLSFRKAGGSGQQSPEHSGGFASRISSFWTPK